MQCCYCIVVIFITSDDIKNTVTDHIYSTEIVIGSLNILAPISTYLAPQLQMLILKTFGVWFGGLLLLFFYGVFFVVVVVVLLLFQNSTLVNILSYTAKFLSVSLNTTTIVLYIPDRL